ncbi:hypothetical protein NECAME_00458 [Necator americanus]|uniref:Uncharacterized protein n=1 Tax=Necator americanus TaxID=51031 RepID=W2T4W8_NECAM|nr:hypothetical protein NECAME_00458 [Necator americanus]ETN76933.1 hypothetical protein NECAME_00458 [Necator americanus]
MNTEEGSSTDEKEIVDVLTHHAGEHEWMQPGRTDVETGRASNVDDRKERGRVPLWDGQLNATLRTKMNNLQTPECREQMNRGGGYITCRSSAKANAKDGKSGIMSDRNLTHNSEVLERLECEDVKRRESLYLFLMMSDVEDVTPHLHFRKIASAKTEQGFGRNVLRQIGAYRLWKRAHNIEPRALSQFKNCYFSPIQCVLMERRRR